MSEVENTQKETPGSSVDKCPGYRISQCGNKKEPNSNYCSSCRALSWERYMEQCENEGNSDWGQRPL